MICRHNPDNHSTSYLIVYSLMFNLQISNVMETINNKPQEQAIICIIEDTILWNRVSSKMLDIVNVFHPSELQHEFNPEYKYNGYFNALNIMGISNNHDLCDKLSDIFWDLNAKSKGKADDLAKTIYIEWLVCIKNYCATLKTVA